MGIEIKLTDKQIPVTPVFVHYLANVIDGNAFNDMHWHDQLSEELSQEQKKLLEEAQSNAQKVIQSPIGQKAILRVYELFVALLTGDYAKIRDIQFRFHFINIIGVPRHGGSYLTKEVYQALGHDPETVPNAIAHDGFPESSPFKLEQGQNSWTTSLQTMAEYLTMVEIYFGQDKPHSGKIIVPKKLTKGTYSGGFFHRVLGESVEHILTLRHPAMAAISTYEKSGGLPEGEKFAIRGNIEEWIKRDLVYTGRSQAELLNSNYFDAYLAYWEQYHYLIATTGLSANKNMKILAYGKERMEKQAQSFHNRFESGQTAEEFKVFDKRDRHPDWMKKAEPAIMRVKAVWDSVGLDFPTEEIMEAW